MPRPRRRTDAFFYRREGTGSASEGAYHSHSNGHSEHSPNSSHISVHSDEPLVRTHKQQTTQQVTTVKKVVREFQILGDGQPGEYVPVPIGAYPHPAHQRPQYVDYMEQPPHHMYSQYHQHPHYQVRNLSSTCLVPLFKQLHPVFLQWYIANDGILKENS